MNELYTLSIEAFVDYLRDEGIQRFYFVWDDDAGRLRASHPQLDAIAAAMTDDERDFDRHEGFFAWIGPRTGVLQGACVHRTCRGQAAGGVRYWRYDTLAEYLHDGLRLARGMTHKNALAGLWWGGGKGVMAQGAEPESAERRRQVYEEYGDFITSLRGCYVTAEDVGTGPDDMHAIFTRSRFTTCIPPQVGGSGNPSEPTARGVVRGMEAALAHLGLGTLEGKTVALQGVGHVGEPMARILAARGVKRLVATDIVQANLDAVRAALPAVDLDLRRVERGDNSILAEPCDILAPNATGAMLSEATIPTLNCKIVCGAANNQLADPQRDDQRVQDAGVLYLPDFLVNRMGIVNCADEDAGYVWPDPSFERHLGTDWDNSIYNLSQHVLREADRTGRTTAAIALGLAEARSLQEHPIHGHRGKRIVAGLVRDGWEQG